MPVEPIRRPAPEVTRTKATAYRVQEIMTYQSVRDPSSGSVIIWESAMLGACAYRCIPIRRIFR
jgi:hypothetical protein